jgi:hypothetical protein
MNAAQLRHCVPISFRSYDYAYGAAMAMSMVKSSYFKSLESVVSENIHESGICLSRTVSQDFASRIFAR